ncbi:MAG: ABC transporter ATP-binding protein [Kiloniellales bacterium]
MSEVVSLQSASKRYGRIVALEDATVILRPGETVALVGHNGAGKTTLMKLVLGLVRPSAGSVRVFGEDPAGSLGAEVRRRVGFLPESVAFHDAMTGRELLGFYAGLKGSARAANRELLDRVGLAAAADRRVATYSKGMRQRLGLAQALLGEPGLLLLDEPTSGLDPESRAQVYETIDGLRRRNATVLVSTHALAEIEHHVDRVALLHRGRLLALGPIGALREAAALPLTVRLTVKTCTTETVLAQIGDCATMLERDSASLLLAVEPSSKLAFLEQLGRLRPWLADVEIETPGLTELYRHLVSQRETAP